MDTRGFHPAESEPSRVVPAETWLASSFDADTAARLAYQDQFSYGRALHEQFVEAERAPYDWGQVDADTFSRERFGSDSEAYQAFWKSILGSLKESSSVEKLRQAKGQVEAKSDLANVYRAMGRAVSRAFEKVPLSEKQRNQFRDVWTNRDFTLMSAAIELADQVAKAKDEGIVFDEDGRGSDGFELEHNLFESLVIANPKLRPMDYWDSKDARGYLRRLGELEHSEIAKGKMKRDLGDVRNLRQAA